MDVYRYLPDSIMEYIKHNTMEREITEIRLRANNPVCFTTYGRMITAENIVINSDKLENILYSICRNSINIYDEEISQGYITLDDGCRVGIGGEYCFDKSSNRYILKHLMSLNIRIPRDLVHFENQEILFKKKVKGTLIIGPPHSGKTSLLKIYAKQLSEKYRVVICDERKEIYSGNFHCDVISGIKKSVAVSMATRTLNPQYILCDEIGLKEEAEEILSAVNTGVIFICSAHGENIDGVLKRPNIKLLADSGIFEKYVLLEQINNKFIVKDYIDA